MSGNEGRMYMTMRITADEEDPGSEILGSLVRIDKTEDGSISLSSSGKMESVYLWESPDGSVRGWGSNYDAINALRMTVSSGIHNVSSLEVTL